MTRETSREAFKELIDSGALHGKQLAALRAVYHHGPGTSAEIIGAGLPGGNVNLWRARFTELQARGLIVEAGTRKCKVTGRSALVWEYSKRTKPLPAQHRVGADKLRTLLGRACKLLQAHGGGAATSAAELLEEVRAAGVRV